MDEDLLKEKGIRFTLEAEPFISKHNITAEEILSLDKLFISTDDLEPLLKKRTEEETELSPAKSETKAEVSLPSGFEPLAKEHDAQIIIRDATDVTGKSRTEGKTDDFVTYFRNRYERLAAILRSYGGKYPETDLQGISKLE